MKRKLFALILLPAALFLFLAAAPAAAGSAAATESAVSAEGPETDGEDAVQPVTETDATETEAEKPPRATRTVKPGAAFYIVGNTDCYPFEYYDAAGKTFQGILPDLLGDIAAENDILFFYLNSTGTRKELVKNAQGELISACIDDEFETLPRTEPLFTYVGSDNETHTVRLAFTDAAGEDLIALITECAAKVSDQQKLNYYYTFTVSDKDDFKPFMYITALSVCLAAIAGLICLAVYQSGQLKRRKQFALETDFVMTMDELKRYFDSHLKDGTRNLYDIIFVRCRFEAENARTDELRRNFAQLIRGCFVADEQIGFLNAGFCVIANSEDGDPADLITAVEQARAADMERMDLSSMRVNYGVYRLAKTDRSFISAADKAIRSAEFAAETGAVSVFYAENAEQMAEKAMFSADELKEGLKKGEFRPIYQPVFNASTGKIAMFEVFGRWESQKYGYIREQSFREYCRRNGLIAELDLRIFSESCRRQSYRMKLGKPTVPVICNFSRRSLLSRNFIVNVLKILKKTGCDASDFIFELRMKDRKVDPAALAEVTDKLREIGVAVCLDVAGTGVIHYGDFSRIKADYLKIDDSILRDVGRNEVTVLLLNLAAALRDMNVKLIGNGISDAGLLDKAVRIGSDYLQGDYCCAQIDAAGAEKLLDADRKETKRG